MSKEIVFMSGEDLLVEPGDVGDLSRALERMWTNAEMRERLRRLARETFIEKFSAEAFTDALRVIHAESGIRSADG